MQRGLRFHFPVIDSTNTWAKRQAHRLPLDQISLITASQQTAGRGRLARRWHSPKAGNLYSTFFLTVGLNRIDLANIPQVLALSVASVLQTEGVKVRFKWPNDLLLDGKKVAGILTETVRLPRRYGVVVGLGLNVNMGTDELTQIDRPATSLAVATGREFSLGSLTHALLQQFSIDCQQFVDQGFRPFRQQLESLSAYRRGDPIAFTNETQAWKGRYHSLHGDGSLNVVLEGDSSIRTFHAGEVLFDSN
jgi:BirA family transcriptional regulator, biotin operon repressor / biotin---[acetyl-CoA-carboxylase] ligase